MSKFFEDVGSFITAPVRTIYNVATGNPKYNSLGDIYNHTVGPDNPIADTFQNEGLNKAANMASYPSWDELGKPGQAFATQVDKPAGLLPADWRPYVQPVEAAALSLFNPFAGAAFETAYQGGKQQQQQKGFDWGELGKNAAINFGTAGASELAKGALSAANVAQQGQGVLSGFNNGASSALQSTVDAAKAGTQGALSAFGPGAIAPIGSTLSRAVNLSGSGLGDKVYNAALKSAAPLTNAALTNTLAPSQATPISGAMDSFAPINAASSGTPQYGDILNAFGGGEINTANPNGPRIDTTAFNSSVNRLAANDYLQQNQTKDVSLPAGQYQPSQNTPYANRLSDINKGTTQAYKDLLDQTNNANSYYGIVDSNPGLTSDQLDAYLKDPSSGVLGNFTVSPDLAKYLQSIHSLNGTNMSLL